MTKKTKAELEHELQTIKTKKPNVKSATVVFDGDTGVVLAISTTPLQSVQDLLVLKNALAQLGAQTDALLVQMTTATPE